MSTFVVEPRHGLVHCALDLWSNRAAAGKISKCLHALLSLIVVCAETLLGFLFIAGQQPRDRWECMVVTDEEDTEMVSIVADRRRIVGDKIDAQDGN